MDEAKATKTERNRRKKEAAKKKKNKEEKEEKDKEEEEERVLKEAIKLANIEKKEIDTQNKLAEIEASKRRKLFEIKEAPGKGQGMFAIKNIRRGTLIFVEWPLMIHGPVLVRTARDSTMRRYHKQLFDTFWALPKADCTCEDPPPCTCANDGYERILYENHFAYDSEMAVYEYASKINHSCNPNTRWSPFEGPPEPELPMILYFVAIRAIEKGEEITIQYESLLGKTELRRATLLDVRRFECMCKACVNDEEVTLAMFCEIKLGDRAGTPIKDTEILGKPSNERIWLEQNLDYWNTEYEKFLAELTISEKFDDIVLYKAGVPKEKICEMRMMNFKQARLEWLIEYNPYKLPVDFLRGHLEEMAVIHHLHLMEEFKALERGLRGKVTELPDPEPEQT